jgi:hypothetical protein
VRTISERESIKLGIKHAAEEEMVPNLDQSYTPKPNLTLSFSHHKIEKQNQL